MFCVACNGTEAEAQADTVEPVPLTEEEIGILEAMGEDIRTVSDEDYGTAVTELTYHTDAYSGQVYQLEGVYTTVSIDGVETPYVYRTMVHDDEKTTWGLPLKYLEKDLTDNSWIRVTGIVNAGSFGDTTCTVLEVVAVESFAEAGQAELQWSGPSHQH